MLSKEQLNKIAEVGSILTRIAESEDKVDRCILAATGNLYLRNVLTEELNKVSTDMIDIPDFLKK